MTLPRAEGTFRLRFDLAAAMLVRSARMTVSTCRCAATVTVVSVSGDDGRLSTRAAVRSMSRLVSKDLTASPNGLRSSGVAEPRLAVG